MDRQACVLAVCGLTAFKTFFSFSFFLPLFRSFFLSLFLSFPSIYFQLCCQSGDRQCHTSNQTRLHRLPFDWASESHYVCVCVCIEVTLVTYSTSKCLGNNSLLPQTVSEETYCYCAGLWNRKKEKERTKETKMRLTSQLWVFTSLLCAPPFTATQTQICLMFS